MQLVQILDEINKRETNKLAVKGQTDKSRNGSRLTKSYMYKSVNVFSYKNPLKFEDVYS